MQGDKFLNIYIFSSVVMLSILALIMHDDKEKRENEERLIGWSEKRVTVAEVK